MLKGMKIGIVCIVLASVLVAPATYAQGWSDTFSPLGAATQVLKNLYQGLQDAVSAAWTATFDSADAPAVQDPLDPTPTLTSEPPPPPAPANNGDDDDGNHGGGMDPLG